MKARQLILEADSSTESRAAALQGRTNPEMGTELNGETEVKEKEVLVEKDLWTFAVLPLFQFLDRKRRKEPPTTDLTWS
ncbi:hypothetical protein AXG93_3022s1130 [Marchantia polymorpha subsp. ruderalis]|uniref:Uncharacterized protein n=1 Tax=Marchantia polymorpha subsp. ruderalis TaxID=1480154 RepID=A0A176VDF0_MARPO|nr:hypothetical protein AXG93_3022s1130 [Marchantia polymorpha subsp. ruderalis]